MDLNSKDSMEEETSIHSREQKIYSINSLEAGIPLLTSLTTMTPFSEVDSEEECTANKNKKNKKEVTK